MRRAALECDKVDDVEIRQQAAIEPADLLGIASRQPMDQEFNWQARALAPLAAPWGPGW